MVGVNQVIMLSLNMVIIASMIGAGGLGFDVLAALRRLDIGGGLEAGLRHRRACHRARPAEPGLGGSGGAPVARRRRRAFCRAPSLSAGGAGDRRRHRPSRVLSCRRSRPGPRRGRLSTGTFWAGIVEWINVNYFDALEAVKNVVLLNLLIPVKRFLIGAALARRRGAAGACRAGGSAGCGSRSSAGGLAVLIAAHRAVGGGDDHGLSLRHLGRHRHADRRADRHPRAERDRLWRVGRGWSSTRCRPCPPSST